MSDIIKLGMACLLVFSLAAISFAADNVNPRKKLELNYRLSKPPGTGPFPAVMLVPGCSGFEAGFAKPHYDGVQQRLVALGFVTVRVNYLAARNARNCLSVAIQMVAGDIAITAEFLRKQAYVKTGAINMLGWSYGGAGALKSLSPGPERKAVDVDTVAVYYPACRRAGLWNSAIPVLWLHGAADNVARSDICADFFSGLPANTRLTFRIYMGAHHGFDNANIPEGFQYRFGTLAYNEEAAKAAWKELTAFLLK